MRKALASLCLLILPFLPEAASLRADEPPPASIAIGLLVPSGEGEAASLREGAMLGINHANQAPGGRARLVVRGRPGQWGTEGDEAAALALDDEVAAIIAPPSGTASHQILQVAGRTRVPVASLCADSSVTGTGVPWLVRIVPRSDEEAGTLFTTLTHGADGKSLRWTALVPPDRAGREAARDLIAAAKAAHCLLEEPIRLPVRADDLSTVFERLLTSHANAILLWCEPILAGPIARSLRQASFSGLLAGPGRLRSLAFVSAAGRAAEGVILPAIVPTSNSVPGDSFPSEYRRRFGREPDFMAEMAHDAALVLIDVLRRSGSQPPHRAFPLTEPVAGTTGLLRFDSSGNRLTKLVLVVCHEDRFKPFVTVPASQSVSTPAPRKP